MYYTVQIKLQLKCICSKTSI